MSAFLIAESGHRVALDQRAVRVGSDASAEIPILGDCGLAPLHYEIMPNEHGHWIRRLHAEYALLINGAETDVALLKDGDVISAGGLRLMFRREVALATEPASAPAISDSRPIEVEADGNAELVPMSEAERRIARLMQQTEERTAKQLELLKQEQNFSGAALAAILILLVTVFAYSLVCNLPWRLFIPGILALGFGIGWIVKVVGKGLDPCFGQLAAGTALLAVLLVNVLAVSGLFEMHEEISEPAKTTEAVKSDYSSEAQSVEQEEKYDGSGWMKADADGYAEQARLAALQAQQAAGEAGRIARHEPDPSFVPEAEKAEISSAPTVTVVQTVGFFWIMFGPKSLMAYFLMTAAAYRTAFRSLSSHEASILHGSR
jgi:Inner membrane component of T3SS, cytoplasmic domain